MEQFSSDEDEEWFDYFKETEISSEIEEDGSTISSPSSNGNLSTINEIEEEDSGEFFEIQHQIPEKGIDMYVAVGKNSSSMDALLWTLKHSVNPSALVYLIHIFPEVHRIPSPLGMLPKNSVRPEQVESYMFQERIKRAALLQQFLNHCDASKVKAESILVESDLVAKAVVDLIHVLNIRKLVVGTTKSSLGKLKKGSGTAEEIYKNAPDFCRVTIICQGKEVVGEMTSRDNSSNCTKERTLLHVEESKNFISCTCFSSQFS
ncbi:U-box domain-containing protein 33-like [Tasmannia lanceolata]|uniref:U-box domain-containing protein 33-like n=1 Tax=Tasmannia lanceolata TaxID=3420 RepID=UPI00406412E9